MLHSFRILTGAALLGCVVAGVLVGTDDARWAGAIIAVLAFTAGYLYGRPTEGGSHE